MNACQENNSRENPTGEVYTSSNIIIRYLAKRFFIRLSSVLERAKAVSMFGLDIGIAEGHMTSMLVEKKLIKKMVGIEIDLEKLRRAKNLIGRIDCINSDANFLNFKSDVFDFIIITEVLEHLSDPSNVLNEIVRVAKKDAIIIISVPYEPFFHIGNLIRGKHLKQKGFTPSHLNFWTRGEFLYFVDKFIDIKDEYRFSTFPWLLYYGIPKQIKKKRVK